MTTSFAGWLVEDIVGRLTKSEVLTYLPLESRRILGKGLDDCFAIRMSSLSLLSNTKSHALAEAISFAPTSGCLSSVTQGYPGSKRHDQVHQHKRSNSQHDPHHRMQRLTETNQESRREITQMSEKT